MFVRLSTYFSSLRRLLGTWGAVLFMWGYLLARLRGDAPGRLHRIRVGPYVFYFPLVAFFAGLFNEIFFKEEYYLERTDAPIRAIDGGANIGVALLYIKLRAPNAQVTCIEPNPAACAVLQKNIEANGWQSSVKIIPTALGKSAGTAQFFLLKSADTDSSGSLAAKENSSRKQRSFSVSVEPLSQYMTEPVDYLKLDIEGAEFDVLEELRVAGRLGLVSMLQLEYHYEPGVLTRPLSDMLTFLEKEGFQTAVQNTVNASAIISRNWRRNCMVYGWKS